MVGGWEGEPGSLKISSPHAPTWQVRAEEDQNLSPHSQAPQTLHPCPAQGLAQRQHQKLEALELRRPEKAGGAGKGKAESAPEPPAAAFSALALPQPKATGQDSHSAVRPWHGPPSSRKPSWLRAASPRAPYSSQLAQG